MEQGAHEARDCKMPLAWWVKEGLEEVRARDSNRPTRAIPREVVISTPQVPLPAMRVVNLPKKRWWSSK